MTDVAFKIHVTKTGYEVLDGEWEVSFSNGYAMHGKETTFCMLRKGIWHPPHAGCAILNPKDLVNPDRGRQTAFKRAIMSLAKMDMLNTEQQKHVISRFRGALWIAMGRPGYKKLGLQLIRQTFIENETEKVV